MKNFNDKIVAITGAAMGMGRAYAFEFAKLGSHLAICDIDEVELEKVGQQLKQQYPNLKVCWQKVDVSSQEEVFGFADKVKAELGNTHIIINNAGVEGHIETVYDITVEQYRRHMGINFWSVIYGTKAFLPQLVANQEGAVVNVSSTFGLVGIPNCSDYCSAKFAVRGFTESLMVEFAESPISIHCVHPGGIATNIVRSEKGKAFDKKFLTTPPEDIAKYVIKCIKKRKAKIVYGNDSFRLLLAANFVPMSMFIKLAWKDLSKVYDIKAYRKFIPGLK